MQLVRVLACVMTTLLVAACGGGADPVAQTPPTVPVAAANKAPLAQPAATFEEIAGYAARAYPNYFYGGYGDGQLYVGAPFNDTFTYRAFGSGNYVGLRGQSVYIYG